jgi:restriction system protein
MLGWARHSNSAGCYPAVMARVEPGGTGSIGVDDLLRYTDLMLPTLRAVDALGGSGSAREITAKVLEVVAPTDEQLALSYDSRPKSILIDRIDWARSYCKLGGALESPRRGLFLMTALGREIAQLSDAEAIERLLELDRQVRTERRRNLDATETPVAAEEGDDEANATAELYEQILRRLHRLTPEGFEEFCLYVLRAYGMELSRTGGSGDEGIDGIGTAPLSPVLSATVAVQAKRWDPATVVSREKVALFQRDARAKGAERAVIITLGKFSEPARQAARQATPTVDLIDGQRLCELLAEKQIGLGLAVDEGWFDRFD